VSAATTTALDTARLTPEQGRRLLTLGGAIAAVGILASIGGAVVDHERFAFSYLTAFMYVTTLGLGGLFFVLIQHLVNAGWSVAPRRQMEWLSGILPICALLFLPIAFFSHDIWHHWMSAEAANDEILVKKQAYLNPTFFFIRAALFFAIWSLLSLTFRRASAAQDVDGDVGHTLRSAGRSAPAMLLFALSLTFAAFDWLMSLDPHWYSTIFGVYVFAGSVTSSLAALALMTISLQRSGLLNRVSTVEHRHDIGKLLFGFTVFWAYIGFSQFFLIWYANIPEETIFYLHRWEGSWSTVSMALLFGHFVVPFFLLLPRTTKRSYLGLGLGAVILLIFHYVDLYWLVMPTLDHHGAHFSWIDIATLLATVGVLAAWLGFRASRDNLYPIKDPRLVEAVQLVNL
jgi:hypothetical protein